jgi:hypothetical protein
MRVLLCALVFMLQNEKPKPWIGISMTLETNVPDIEGKKYKQAIRVHTPVYNSPADKAGLRHGDLLVAFDGVDFDGKSDELISKFRDAISSSKVGAVVTATVIRDWVDKTATVDGRPVTDIDPESILMRTPPGPKFEMTAQRRRELLQIPVTLEAKTPFHPAKKAIPADAEIFKIPFPVSAEEKLARALIQEYGIEADVKDLHDRLSKLHQDADPWRLTRFAYAHRNPFAMPAASWLLIQRLLVEKPALILQAAEWLDRPMPDAPKVALQPAGRTVEQRIDEIIEVLRKANIHYYKAFEKLSDEETAFLMTQLDPLGESFTRGIYLDRDEKRERIEPNLRVIKLASKVDFIELFRAAHLLASFVEDLNRDFKSDLEKGLADSVVTRDSEFGKIVIAGKDRHWHREDAAVLIDLGGDDFYTNNAGASAGRKMPFAIVVDFAGDDAYEATFDWAQGVGRLGIGILADWGGKDSYIAQRWGQGSAAFGVGLLYDSTGDDSYRGWDYVQGAALWGIALSYDTAGDDTYTATRFSQACAMPGGFAYVFNGSGKDSYFCKGKYPTNYGDAGLFDAWSQGCAIGFRGIASGGIALLADLAGDDRYEAGHFSQGGGYYFGWGLLYEGDGNDVYIGSRYAQGFAAHEAMGYFADTSGNDRYSTRHAVAQGLSWDETVVVFIDSRGDDIYDGGGGFSQGATAHNGFCLFVDYEGKDTYRLPAGPARSGPNDYHGGTSLSIVIDAGGAKDEYDSKEVRNDAILKNGAHGLFFDLPGKIESADWKSLIQK